MSFTQSSSRTSSVCDNDWPEKAEPDQRTRTVRVSSRDYTKCHQCRRDSKKCSPRYRDWSTREKCERCALLDHPCGPGEKAHRKVKALRDVELIVVPDEWTKGQTYTLPPHKIKDLVTLPTTKYDDISLQSALGRVLGRSAKFGRASYELAVNCTAQKLLTRCQSDLRLCQKSDVDVPQSFIAESVYLCQDLVGFVSMKLTKLQEHQLYGIGGCQRYSYNSSNIILLIDGLDEVDTETGDFKTLMCTANVLRTHPHNSQTSQRAHHAYGSLPAEYYKSTEATLTVLLAAIHKRDDLFDESIMHCQSYSSSTSHSVPFPASHIAYWNFDKDVAFELWKVSVDHGPMVDVLGRAFPHIVAEAGDFALLSKMSDWQLKTTPRDSRGLSLLDLAVVGNNEMVVGMLLDRGIVTPPYTRAMQRAISIGSLEIASNRLLQYLKSTPPNSSHEIDVLIGMANRKGFTELELCLKGINLQSVNPQQAIESLDVIDFTLSSNGVQFEDSYLFGMSWLDNPFESVSQEDLSADTASSQSEFSYELRI